LPEQSCGKNLCVVEEKDILRAEEIEEITDVGVGQDLPRAVQNQQAGSITPVHGILRDQLRGQFVIAVV
jgi:hypothetical protein